MRAVNLLLEKDAVLRCSTDMANFPEQRAMPVLHLKLRPDTPQRYEDIHLRGLTLDDSGGTLLSAKPWTQYVDLKGQPAPRSTVSNITISDTRGRFGAVAEIQGNPGQTEISNITLQNIDVQLKTAALRILDVKDLKIINVVVNGKSLPPAARD